MQQYPETETRELKQERIRIHLEGVIVRMEQDVNSSLESEAKHIQVDAATTVALTLVAELLPGQIQEQVRKIITLHEKTWNIDLPTEEGEIPPKPLPEELLDQVSRTDDSSEA